MVTKMAQKTDQYLPQPFKGHSLSYDRSICIRTDRMSFEFDCASRTFLLNSMKLSIVQLNSESKHHQRILIQTDSI